FVSDAIRSVDANAADRAGIHESLYSGAPRDFEHRPGAFNVRLVHLLWLARPQAVVRCHVEDHTAALYGALERCRIAQVTLDRLYPRQLSQLSRIACQRAYRSAAFEQGA